MNLVVLPSVGHQPLSLHLMLCAAIFYLAVLPTASELYAQHSSARVTQLGCAEGPHFLNCCCFSRPLSMREGYCASLQP